MYMLYFRAARSILADNALIGVPYGKEGYAEKAGQ